MAEARPEKSLAERHVLSMKLQVGDRLADETAVWEIIGRAVHDEHGGKTPTFACAASTRPAVTEIRTWSAHERISVRRANVKENER